MVKRILSVIMTVIMLSGVVACDKKTDDEEKKDRRHAYSMLHAARSEDGIFYIGDDDLVHFSSVETGKDSPICFEPSCEHEPASAKNPDPVCRAALFPGSTKIAYYEGNIYYFVYDGTFDSKIYRMDINGGARELVAQLPFSYMIMYGVVFDGDCVYYTGKFYEIADDGFDINSYVELVEVNLKDGSYRIITDGAGGYHKTVTEFDVYDNTLYAEVKAEGDYRLVVVNLDTLDAHVETDTENYLERMYAGAYDAESFYYYNNYTGEIGIYDMTDCKSKVLVETGSSYPAVWAYDREIFYQLRTDNGTKSYFYSVDDDKLTDITKICDDYNIKYYDGYCDIFIAYKYRERENQNSGNGKIISGYTAYSRKEIVGD